MLPFFYETQTASKLTHAKPHTQVTFTTWPEPISPFAPLSRNLFSKTSSLAPEVLLSPSLLPRHTHAPPSQHTTQHDRTPSSSLDHKPRHPHSHGRSGGKGWVAGTGGGSRGTTTTPLSFFSLTLTLPSVRLAQRSPKSFNQSLAYGCPVLPSSLRTLSHMPHSPLSRFTSPHTPPRTAS